MKHARYRLEALASHHDRTGFTCGVAPLDDYFKKLVTQDVRRRVTACFVAMDAEDHIAGFYTLASSSVPVTDLPEHVQKKLPRYPLIPAVRMGRLAVHDQHRGKGLGAALLADALTTALRAEIAAYALLVDAKDETAVRFYKHHGFIALPDAPKVLFLPLATARKLFISC